MSHPIVACQVYKAALGDEEAFLRLARAMKINLAYGSYSTFPCQCQPPCQVPTPEQFEALDKRIDEYLKTH